MSQTGVTPYVSSTTSAARAVGQDLKGADSVSDQAEGGNGDTEDALRERLARTEAENRELRACVEDLRARVVTVNEIWSEAPLLGVPASTSVGVR